MKRTILSLAAIAAAALAPSTASAAVEYVRICTTQGAGYYYVPGTDYCFNETTHEIIVTGPRTPNFGITVADRIETLNERIGFALSGAAIGIALPNPIMPEGDRFAITGNWGQVAGANAFGLSAAVQLTPHFLLTGAAGMSPGTGVVGTRAGWNLSFGGR